MTPTQFKDTKGRIWDIQITLYNALLVDRSDFTEYTAEPVILSRFDQDCLTTIFTNPAVQFAVIGILVRDQCMENLKFTITSDEDEERFQQEFTQAIDGPCMEAARNALVEAMANFFPAAKTALSTFLQRLDHYREKVSKRLESEILPMLDQQMEESLEAEMAELKKKLHKNRSETSTP